MAKRIDVEDIVAVFCLKYRDEEITFEELKAVMKMLGFDIDDDFEISLKEEAKKFIPLDIDAESKTIKFIK